MHIWVLFDTTELKEQTTVWPQENGSILLASPLLSTQTPALSLSFKSPISRVFSPCSLSVPINDNHISEPSPSAQGAKAWGAVLQEDQCLYDTVLIRSRRCCYFLYNLASVCLNPECIGMAPFSICGQEELYRGLILLGSTFRFSIGHGVIIKRSSRIIFSLKLEDVCFGQNVDVLTPREAEEAASHM